MFQNNVRNMCELTQFHNSKYEHTQAAYIKT
jgi:hypothetical protein